MLSIVLPFFLLFGSITTSDEIEVVPIQHASLILKWDGKVVHVDPWGQGDYTNQPLADLILITDVHGDHLDLDQISKVSKESTVIVGPVAVQETVAQAEILKNGQKNTFLGIVVEAVPMYNLERGPGPGRLYHPKGRGNGYILTLGGTRVYISGDTACIPEMKALKGIDIAFICMNLPYTMTPEEAAQCVNSFAPRIVYPYHHRGSDPQAFQKAVTTPGVEVRILDWY